ncbi:MAG: hypothetical protein ACHQ53_04850 [Polyangiales bacterium]
MRGSAMILGALLCACALGCRHDLNALRSGGGKTSGLRDSGTPAKLMDSGVEDAGDAGGHGDGGTAGAPSPAACEPCDPLPDAGMIALRSCCLGLLNRQCGLTFGGGGVCLQRDVPGQADTECPGATARQMKLDGCCRPDGRCGLNAPNYGVGCGAREELLVQLGSATASAASCKYDCTTDADCSAVSGYSCAEDPTDSTHKKHICVKTCHRDMECAKDQVCAPQSDMQMGGRILAFCQAPVGSMMVNDPCAIPGDCAQHLCIRVSPGSPDGYCSQLCVTKADCPSTASKCLAQSFESTDAGPTLRVCNR